MNVSVSVNVCLKAYSKTGPHIHLVQEYSGAHASAARPPGGRTTALHDLYWATGCAVSMSNTRGVAVCDTRDTNTSCARDLEHYTFGVLGMSTATGACSLPHEPHEQTIAVHANTVPFKAPPAGIFNFLPSTHRRFRPSVVAKVFSRCQLCGPLASQA